MIICCSNCYFTFLFGEVCIYFIKIYYFSVSVIQVKRQNTLSLAKRITLTGAVLLLLPHNSKLAYNVIQITKNLSRGHFFHVFVIRCLISSTLYCLPSIYQAIAIFYTVILLCLNQLKQQYFQTKVFTKLYCLFTEFWTKRSSTLLE